MIGTGRDRFRPYFAARAVFRLDDGVPITALAGVHPGCFELFAHEPIRTISDLRGKKVGIDVLGAAKHRNVAIMAAHIGLDPEEGHRSGWRKACSECRGTVRRKGSRCVSRHPSRTAGDARPQDRTGDHRHDHGQAVVTVFLLHGDRQPGVRSRPSGRHQASPARRPQGHRHLRRGAGECRTAAGRSRDTRERYDYALRDGDRAALRAVARARSRGIRCASSRCGCTRPT